MNKPSDIELLNRRTVPLNTEAFDQFSEMVRRDAIRAIRPKDATFDELREYVFRKHRRLFSRLAKS